MATEPQTIPPVVDGPDVKGKTDKVSLPLDDGKSTSTTEKPSENKNEGQTEIRQMIDEKQRQMEKEGHENGSLGIALENTHIESRANIQAASVHQNANIKINQEIASLTVNVEKLQEDYARERAACEKENKQFEFLLHSKHHTPNSHSNIAIFLYLFFGLFLLLADIPLAVQLIQIGFKFINPQQATYPIHNLISGQFWKVFEANWEVFITAIGISFCTIIIKIIYDEYMSTGFAAKVMKRKRFFELFEKPAANGSYFTVTDRRLIFWENLLKSLVKIGILVATIYMIIVLGKFRVKSLELVDVQTYYAAEVKKLDTQYGNDVVGKEIAVGKLKTLIDDREKTIRAGAGNVFNLTFSLITLLLPIISGICFSLSLSAWQNRRKINYAKKQKKKANARAEKEKEKLEKITGVLAKWETEKVYLAQDNWIKSFANDLIKAYEYGYNRGRILPEIANGIPDIMNIVETWRNKLVYFKTNQKLLKQRGDDTTKAATQP